MDTRKISIDMPKALDKAIEKEAKKEDRAYNYIVRQVLIKHFIK